MGLISMSWMSEDLDVVVAWRSTPSLGVELHERLRLIVSNDVLRVLAHRWYKKGKEEIIINQRLLRIQSITLSTHTQQSLSDEGNLNGSQRGLKIGLIFHALSRTSESSCHTFFSWAHVFTKKTISMTPNKKFQCPYSPCGSTFTNLHGLRSHCLKDTKKHPKYAVVNSWSCQYEDCTHMCIGQTALKIYEHIQTHHSKYKMPRFPTSSLSSVPQQTASNEDLMESDVVFDDSSAIFEDFLVRTSIHLIIDHFSETHICLFTFLVDDGWCLARRSGRFTQNVGGVRSGRLSRCSTWWR